MSFRLKEGKGVRERGGGDGVKYLLPRHLKAREISASYRDDAPADTGFSGEGAEVALIKQWGPGNRCEGFRGFLHVPLRDAGV